MEEEFNAIRGRFVDPTIEFRDYCALDEPELDGFLELSNPKLRPGELGAFRRLWNAARASGEYFI